MGVKNTGCAHISFRDKNYRKSNAKTKGGDLSNLSKKKKHDVSMNTKIFNIMDWLKDND